MADLRIYRALLVLVAFAVVVFAFSFESQPTGATGSQAVSPSFAQADASMRSLARRYPDRQAGSPGDQRLAQYVSRQLTRVKGFTVRTREFDAMTARGPRALQSVAATSLGTGGGVVVVVSHRDAADSQAVSGLSGTAVMLDLARALSGETLGRSVMLVSTSGEVGAAGATELARSLLSETDQVDAVLVLGDLAGAGARRPFVVPWSAGGALAPLRLRNTLSRFVSVATGLHTGGAGLGGQLARLAFPFALTAQAPFNAAGIPAVLLSVSGDEPFGSPVRLAGSSRLAGMGSAVLQTVNQLDHGPRLRPPGAYLTIGTKSVPSWALRLLALALILPVAAATFDAVARTRRRGHGLLRWVGWVLAGAVPFLAGLVLLSLARVAGWPSGTPPGAVLGGAAGGGGVALTGSDVALLAVVVLVIVAGFVWLRPLCLRQLARLSGSTRRPESPAADAAAVALSVVMCALALAVWVANPVAALLLVPALHLWLWLAQPAVRTRRAVVVALLVLAVVPPALVGFYYLNAYSLSPLGLTWSVVLMIGGVISVGAAIGWSVALGALASAIVICVRCVRAAARVPEPAVSMRGPTSYAGPGSLGGTESALRR